MRLKQRLEEEYRIWCSRMLNECGYAYIWADGVYLGAGVDGENTAMLCVMGAREDGVKELPGMELGCRESTESWSGALLSQERKGRRTIPAGPVSGRRLSEVGWASRGARDYGIPEWRGLIRRRTRGGRTGSAYRL